MFVPGHYMYFGSVQTNKSAESRDFNSISTLESIVFNIVFFLSFCALNLGNLFLSFLVSFVLYILLKKLLLFPSSLLLTAR